MNITYNTTRLNSIIQDFHDKQNFRAKRKAQLRGKPASALEIKEAIHSYLNGQSVSEISQSMYRSTGFIKAILNRVGVPTRPALVEERKGYAFLPDQCVSDEFIPNEKVWSAFYHAPAIIRKESSNPQYYIDKYGCKCYEIYILEETETLRVGGFHGAALACDLGKLTHLEQYGIDIEKI